jgi:thymidylate synthase
MKQWQDILHKAVTHGVERPDRTGIGTLALFGEQLSFDNHVTFPAVTVKELKFGQVKAELACFVRGLDSIHDFRQLGCRIWDGNEAQTAGSRFKPSRPGDLGRIYGVQWRRWRSVAASSRLNGLEHGLKPGQSVVFTDQLKQLVKGLRDNPYGRRHLVTAWNPGELDDMVLPPCHVMFQCFVRPSPMGGEWPMMLDLRVDMRSVDLFLGLPFDIASYALLQRLIAKEVGMDSGRLVFQLGDAHVYLNHGTQVGTVLGRKPIHPPLLRLADDASLFEFHPDQADLIDYFSHPAVSAPLNA